MSNWLAEFLCKKGIVEPEDKEIYVYGYEMIIMTILGAIIVFTTAAFINRFLDAFVFFVVFVITRQYCGGFHAKTRLICTFSFIGCFIFVQLSSKILEPIYSLPLHILIETPYLVTIIGFAPIINENKPLNYDTIISNRRKSIYISIIWIVISLALLVLNPLTASTAALTLLVIAALMIIEIIKRKE